MGGFIYSAPLCEFVIFFFLLTFLLLVFGVWMILGLIHNIGFFFFVFRGNLTFDATEILDLLLLLLLQILLLFLVYSS